MRFASNKKFALGWAVGMLLLCAAAFAQQKTSALTGVNWVPVTGTGAPTTTSCGVTCTSAFYGLPYTNLANGDYYVYTGAGAVSGWAKVNGGGGTLPQTFSPVTHQWIRSYDSATGLFTASQPGFVDISGSLGLSQVNAQIANTMVANFTASSASPTAFVMPSCSGTGNTLNYTNGTGIGCITVAPASGSANYVQTLPTTSQTVTTPSGYALTFSSAAATSGTPAVKSGIFNLGGSVYDTVNSTTYPVNLEMQTNISGGTISYNFTNNTSCPSSFCVASYHFDNNVTTSGQLSAGGTVSGSGFTGGYAAISGTLGTYTSVVNRTLLEQSSGTAILRAIGTGTTYGTFQLTQSQGSNGTPINVATSDQAGHLIAPIGVQLSAVMSAGCLSTDGSGNVQSGCSGVITNPMTTLGDTIYGGASGAATRLAGPTTAATYFLSEIATGSAVAPTWTNAATYLASPPAIGGTTPNAMTASVMTVTAAAGNYMVQSTSNLNLAGYNVMDNGGVTQGAVGWGNTGYAAHTKLANSLYLLLGSASTATQTCLDTNLAAAVCNITMARGSSNTTFGGAAIGPSFNPTAAQTTVSCSTSGNVLFSQPLAGSSLKEVEIYANACVGTASYTYPTAFSHAPQVLSQSLAAVATSVSTTAVTITGTTTTGFLKLDGY